MSFVEKALNRLKQQERDPATGRSPLGSLGVEEATQPEPRRPRRVVAPEGSRLKVTLNRERLKDEGFIVPEAYLQRVADEYRRIKRPLIANAFGIGVPRVDDGNVIVVTSALSGEGKTHTCLNLAFSLAMEKDRWVLLVDGDVPKPHISRMLGVADQPGLLDLLSVPEDVSVEESLIRTDIENLSVLPAGRWHEHATELLASKRMRALSHELSTRYPDRLIIIDSPPLLAATEAQVLAASAGQVALVIAEGLTEREAVRQALALVDENKPVNAIMNKSRRPSAGGYYGSGYRSYGAAQEASHEPV